MANPFLNLKIGLKKRKLRRIMRQYNGLLERYPGGAYIIDAITGGALRRLNDEYEAVKKELQRIDPNYPKPFKVLAGE